MRSGKLAILLVASCVVFAFVAAGCDNDIPAPETTSAAQTSTTAPDSTASNVPAGWITFESDRVSLALPDTFTGGEPTDPDVAPLIQQALGLNDPNMEQLKLFLASTDTHLLILGEPDALGSRPMVMAQGVELPPSTSLRQYVETARSDHPDEEWQIETLTDDRAYIVVRAPASEGSDDAAIRHFAISRAGTTVYSVVYITSEASSGTMEPIFRQSAQTIALKGT